MYRRTKRSREQIARMISGRARARIEGPSPDYPVVLPDLRRTIVIIDHDFGERTHDPTRSCVGQARFAPKPSAHGAALAKPRYTVACCVLWRLAPFSALLKPLQIPIIDFCFVGFHLLED